MLFVMLLNLAFSFPVPEYMKDAVITVKTKDGKEYVFSGNTHKVVTRNDTNLLLDGYIKIIDKIEETKPNRHILSGEIVHSMKRMRTEKHPGYMKAESEFDFGLGLQYQYQFYQDLYFGGRVDTNGGSAINVGFGIK